MSRGSILNSMLKAYCEHGALTADLRAMQREGLVELVRFPYDPNAPSRRIKNSAVPSEAQWRDLNLTWAEDKYTWGDHRGSQHLPAIRQILGGGKRRDALHVDSAFKSGCRAFITRDHDILAHRQSLESLLGIRFFHPDKDREELRKLIYATE